MENKKYWYCFYYTECPVCGSLDKWKERKYSEKPEDSQERYIYKQEYDHCLEY